MKKKAHEVLQAPSAHPDNGIAVRMPNAVADNTTVVMFERLAKDPNVDVEKLERLIQMQKDVMAVQAKAAFNTAFAEMQGELPEIQRNGEIVNTKTGTVVPYALNEDLQAAIRPILKAHGFALSFRTDYPDKDTIRVVGILTHRDGHARGTTFQAASDTSGFKNDTQGRGSVNAYGRRYTTVDLLNITTRGLDRNGAEDQPRSAAQPARQRQATQQPASDARTYSNHTGDKRPITTVNRDGKGKGQLGRLIMIAKKAGRTDDEVKTWLKAVYGWTSKKQITQEAYEAVCAAIEKPGALPLPTRDRVPGEDDGDE